MSPVVAFIHLTFILLLATTTMCLPVEEKSTHVSAAEVDNKTNHNSNNESNKIYCRFQTPCGWRIFNYADYSEITLINSYCTCRKDRICKFHESRFTEGYIEMRCKRRT